MRIKALGRVEARLAWTAWGVAAFCLLTSAPAAADPPNAPILGISELKLGALDHDTPGLWSGFGVERQAVDANVEALFLPWARTFGGYLRPAIGATINFNGDTSKAYADLRWEAQTASGVFFSLGMGTAIHNGELGLIDDAHKALGARVLFHPSAEIGYRFDGVHSVSIFADHMSNGFTHRYNEGMDTVGVRFGRMLTPITPEATPDLPVAKFAGPYVGAFGGYQYETANWYGTRPVDASRGAFAGGGYAGISWQSGQGVFGLEVDAAPAQRSFEVGCDVAGIACQMDSHGLYSLRGRFGWVINNAMIYGTGGVALARWESSTVNLATGQQLDHASGLNYGVAVGAGIEYMLTPNLGIRSEVVHYGIAGWDLALPAGGSVSNQFQSTIGRVGVSWYFH